MPILILFLRYHTAIVAWILTGHAVECRRKISVAPLRLVDEFECFVAAIANDEARVVRSAWSIKIIEFALIEVNCITLAAQSI